MNYKNNLKLSYTIISLFLLVFFTMSYASCQSFSTTCNIDTINDENINQPFIISVFSDSQNTLPEQFDIKITFDNDVFTKSAKIDYNAEISKNYRHNKNICGNQISVCCSLKNNKTAPTIPKNQSIFSLELKCKKHIQKDNTKLIITAENNSKQETINIPIKIQNCSHDQTPPQLSKLNPNMGSLHPPFNPNITEYSLDVPCDTKDITFEYESDNNHSVKINRHKLLSPGSKTDIYVTVKPDQKGTKNVYHISVNREPIPESQSHSKSKNSKSGSKKKSGLFSAPKHKKYDCTDKNSETKEKSPIFKTIELKNNEDSTQNDKKTYSIVILSSVLIISASYILINRKKILKNKISLNKISKK